MGVICRIRALYAVQGKYKVKCNKAENFPKLSTNVHEKGTVQLPISRETPMSHKYVPSRKTIVHYCTIDHKLTLMR